MCVLLCVELLFCSLPPHSHSRRRVCLWLDRAERSWAEQDEADGAEGCCSPSCHPTLQLQSEEGDAFQVLTSGRSACAQTQRAVRMHSYTSAHTQALDSTRFDLAIKGAATGRSCREQKVKTYWILVQRTSKQTKNSRGSAAF